MRRIRSRSDSKTIAVAFAVSLMGGTQVSAADQSVAALKAFPRYDWTGLYLGGHFGYGDSSLAPATNPLALQGVFLPSTATGLIGGYQLGYDWQLNNRLVLGIEADSTFTSPIDAPARTAAPFHTAIDYVGTVRGRIGYAFDRLKPFVSAGFAWGRTHIDINNAAGATIISPGQTHIGWAASAGIDFALSGNWSGKVEYQYANLAPQTYALAGTGLGDIRVNPDTHLIKLGLNYRLGDVPLWPKTATLDALTSGSDAWNIHAQTTYLPQGYGPIRSPYASAQSLPGGGQWRATWTTTAFLGVRLWDGGEFYFNPELAQGFGLNGTLGLAGFSNGEAQKAGAAFPRLRAQRYYLKQTFGLGGEQEEVADGPNALPGKRDINRVTLVLGRFAIGDFFDGNAYAKDPRADFMNWSLWSSAAYDFPADLPGYTRGAVAELNQKDWAIRGGVFQVPSAPNSDVLTFRTGGAVAEFEERHTLFGQPGKLRLGVFYNRGNMGSYRQATAIAAVSPTLDIDDVMTSIRRNNEKHGFYANLEQALTAEVGLFARVSWNDGQNEILSFTDIDRSVSGGLAIKGDLWGRTGDTIGIGGAINGLSAAHRDFLAAGGTGLLIGDGALNYRTERILETFYAWKLNTWSTMTFDYQFVGNPAYNADRGPVSIFSGRLHAEF